MIAEQGIGRSADAGRLEKAMEVVCGDVKQTSLELNMSSCKKLVDITPLAKLGELRSLQQLTLQLNRCKKLQDVTPLAKLRELRSLQQLTLNLWFCEKLHPRFQEKFTSLAEFLAARAAVIAGR